MPEPTEGNEPPVKKSRMEKIAGPAVFVGCFVIWPATQIAVSVIAYKTVDKQFALESLKQATTQSQ